MESGPPSDPSPQMGAVPGSLSPTTQPGERSGTALLEPDSRYDAPQEAAADLLVQGDRALCEAFRGAPICNWNAWQNWRKRTRSPSAPCVNSLESRLHQRVMLLLYGSAWRSRLSDLEATLEEEIQNQVESPLLVRATAPVTTEGAPASRREAEANQSEGQTSLEPRVETGPRHSPSIAGDQPELAASTIDSVLAAAPQSRLAALVAFRESPSMEPIRPGEQLEDFRKRIVEEAAVLSSLGSHPDPEEIGQLLAQAEIQDLIRDSPDPAPLLSQECLKIAADEDSAPMVRRAKLKACASLLSEWGQPIHPALLEGLLTHSSGSSSSIGGAVSRVDTPQQGHDLRDSFSIATPPQRNRDDRGPSAGYIPSEGQRSNQNSPEAPAALEQLSSPALGEDWPVIDQARCLSFPGYRRGERLGPSVLQEEAEAVVTSASRVPRLSDARLLADSSAGGDRQFATEPAAQTQPPFSNMNENIGSQIPDMAGATAHGPPGMSRLEWILEQQAFAAQRYAEAAARQAEATAR